MKNRNFFLLILSLFIVSGDLTSAWGEESYLTWSSRFKSRPYVIKKGDTLSEILNQQGYKKVWKNRKTNRQLNPIYLVMWQNGLKEEDLLRLEPGQVLYLPVSTGQIRSLASDGPLIEDIPFREVKKEVDSYSQEKADNSWF